jgi:beta-hydroxylase
VPLGARAINRVTGSFLMRAAASPNEIGDYTCGLNRIFRNLCTVRRAGKRLKAWNRTVCYVVKWCLLSSIALAIFWR